MKPSRHLARLRVWSVMLLVGLGLSACFAFPQSESIPSSPPPTAVEQSVEVLIIPSTTPVKQEAVQPSATPIPSQTATPLGMPPLLAAFPIIDGDRPDPSWNYADETRASSLIWTSKNPGEADAFYQRELEKAGWVLRYSESNQVGGFLQEWRKDKSWITVEYHFLEMKPVIQVDLRIIESQQALVILLGFPLPDGTLVTQSDGPSIELYAPQDFDSTVKYFLETMYNKGWKVLEAKVETCGSRSCQETMKEEYRQAVVLQPTPTPDRRKVQSYQVTLKDRTQYRMTFMPHRDGTRIFVDANWTYPYRSWMPIYPYPNGELQAVRPYVMMFTTPDSLPTVVKHYQDSMAALGWQADPNAIYIDQETEYHNTWLKFGQAITITLSRAKGITYGTITCQGCWEQ